MVAGVPIAAVNSCCQAVAHSQLVGHLKMMRAATLSGALGWLR